ncbi:MAG: TolC family protein, partial [Candidatus Dactylopiibacterium sp.]|nr:TolC family protein [Candidatus Dactylopiibacterium sp.]
MPAARLTSLAACLALLTGCVSVGPDYQAPRPATPAHWHGEAAANAPGVPGDWWRGFDDATLDTLVDAALRHSPDLRSAQARLRESRANLGAARAAALPVVDAGASARRSESAGDGEASDAYSVGFDASWELDLFGARRRGVEAASAALEATEADLADVRVSLAAEVARRYLDWRTRQTRLAIARENVASQTETLQIVRWRHDAGLVNALDLLQATSALQAARARLPEFEAALEADLNALAVLSGATRAELATQLLPPRPLPRAPAASALPVPAE